MIEGFKQCAQNNNSKAKEKNQRSKQWKWRTWQWVREKQWVKG